MLNQKSKVKAMKRKGSMKRTIRRHSSPKCEDEMSYKEGLLMKYFWPSMYLLLYWITFSGPAWAGDLIYKQKKLGKAVYADYSDGPGYIGCQIHENGVTRLYHPNRITEFGCDFSIKPSLPMPEIEPGDMNKLGTIYEIAE